MNQYINAATIVVIMLGISNVSCSVRDDEWHVANSARTVSTLRVTCGLYTCDLRTHYCDPIIDSCARCDDDCHPARIRGNQAAIDECHTKCAGIQITF
jgi:hypothetical protein